MSSTTSETRGGGGTDHFPTPRWCIDAILKRFGPLDGKRILEPGSGDGAIVEALLAHGADVSRIQAVEIDPGYADLCGKLCPTLCGDFLATPAEKLVGMAGPFDLIPMNPPFSLAQEFIEHALPMLAPGGVCVVLARQAFAFSGKDRRPFRKKHPYDVATLERRPSFSGEWIRRMEARGADLAAALEPLRRVNKKTKQLETVKETRTRLMGSDSADYCWMIIGNGRGGRFEILEAA